MKSMPELFSLRCCAACTKWEVSGDPEWGICVNEDFNKRVHGLSEGGFVLADDIETSSDFGCGFFVEHE